MNYEKVKQLKNKVEVFEDATFVSALSEDELLIKNNKTGDTWSVQFSHNESGTLVLHGDSALLVEKSEVEQEDDGYSLNTVNEALLTSYADGNREAFKEGLSYVAEAVKRKYGKKKPSPPKKYYERSEYYEKHNAETLRFAEDFESRWSSKLQCTAEAFNELFQHGFLFESDGQFKNVDVVDPEVVLESYRLSKEDHETFLESAQSVVQFYSELKEHGVSEETLRSLPLNESNWDTALTRALVHQKRSGEDVNVVETVRYAKELHEQLFEGSPHWYSRSEQDNSLSYYLKPGLYGGSSVYTRNDLERLISDLTQATATYVANGFTREELRDVSSMKDTVDTMYRTNRIADEEVSKVISDFNSKYGTRSTSIYEPLKNYVGV